MVKYRIFSLAVDVSVAGLVYYLLYCISLGIEVVSLKLLILTLPFALLICRDSWVDRSLGRSMFGIKVVSKQTHKAVKPISGIVRNILLVLWPIELIIFILIHERLVDRILGLEVIKCRDLVKINPRGIILLVVVWLCIYGLLHLNVRSDGLLRILLH